MPKYLYECEKCKKEVSLVKTIKERNKAVCEKCKTPLKRKVEVNSFILLGTGWQRDLG